MPEVAHESTHPQKEAQKQLEFLLAMEKLERVLNGSLKKRPARAKAKAAAA
jgi:hypothetical protein